MNRYVFVLGLLFSISALFANNNDTILLTIDNNKITKAEFLRIYSKNNENAYDSKTIKEYLELFINFKLKVYEAEKLGLDTTEKFHKEFNGYKKQLEEPYLALRNIDDTLLKEAYERMKEEIEVSHILLRVDKNAAPEDTLKIYNKIVEIRNRILSGEDFAAVAKATSDDSYAKKNGGLIGYLSVLQLVYPFESAAYNLEVGEISQPVRTQYGYHIIKLHDRRPSNGKINAAHIMVMVPEGTAEDSVQRAKARIESIYEKVKNGEDFAQLAMEHSDDRRSARNGGDIGWFGAGRMVNEFAEPAFALKNPGDISGIIRTSFGFHIIKLLGRKPVGTFEEVKEDLKKKIDRDSRSKVKDKAFINHLKTEYQFKEVDDLKKDFYWIIDTSIYSEDIAVKQLNLSKVLFSYSDVEITQQEFYGYLINDAPKAQELPIPVFVDKEYDKFVANSLKEYERTKLPEKYPEFKHLIDEYHDGILLFELTDSLVWSKAVIDTVGLEKFYNKNKDNYMWNDRVLATIYTCPTKETAEQTLSLIEKYTKKNKVDSEKVLEDVNADTVLVELITEKYVQGRNQIIDSLGWTPGVSSIIEKEESYIIVNTIEKIKPEHKSLDEARGLIIADYQTYLEDQWIAELREKYTIEVNQEVLNSLQKD